MRRIVVPTELKEIKLSQYQKFIKITKDIDNDELYKKYMVGCFCNLTDKEIGQLSIKDFDEIFEILSNTLKKEPKELQTIIKQNDKKYGFIPDGFENITVNELADIDNFMKDVSNYDKAMNVLYRPITVSLNGKYQIEPYKANGESLDVNLDIALGAVVFFSSLISDLLNCTLNFIHQGAQIDPKLQNLVQNGDGINPFTHSHKETYFGLKKLAL